MIAYRTHWRVYKIYTTQETIIYMYLFRKLEEGTLYILTYMYLQDINILAAVNLSAPPPQWSKCTTEVIVY